MDDDDNFVVVVFMRGSEQVTKMQESHGKADNATIIYYRNSS